MKDNIKTKRLIGKVFLISGIIFVVYSFVATLYRVSFSGFFSLIGASLIIIGSIKLFLKPFKSPALKFTAKAIHILISIGLISFIIVQCLIVGSIVKKDLTRPDYIVILGAGLWGETPSLTLLQRLETSLSLIKLHPDTKIVVSGGQGTGETITEAEAMKRFLLRNGVNENRIIIEDKSTNTFENLLYTNEVLKKVDNKDHIKITIVTSDFHMFRSKFLAGRVGLKPYGYPAPIHPYLIPAYYVREYIAIIKSFLFDIP